jgi:hypothetical protein
MSRSRKARPPVAEMPVPVFPRVILPLPKYCNNAACMELYCAQRKYCQGCHQPTTEKLRGEE